MVAIESEWTARDLEMKMSAGQIEPSSVKVSVQKKDANPASRQDFKLEPGMLSIIKGAAALRV